SVKWGGVGDLLRDPDAMFMVRRIKAFDRTIALTVARVRDAVRSDRFAEARALLDRVGDGLKAERNDLHGWAITLALSSKEERGDDRCAGLRMAITHDTLVHDERYQSHLSRYQSRFTQSYDQLRRMKMTIDYLEALEARGAAATATAKRGS